MQTSLPDKIWTEPWNNPDTVRQQFDLSSRELADWMNGAKHGPFDAFVKLMSHCQQVETLLDVGCGCGYYSAVVKSIDRLIRFTGCDISPAMIDAAMLYYPATYRVADAERLPFADGEFDVVLLGGIVSQTKCPEAAISEAFRVSRRYVMFHRVPCHNDADFAGEARAKMGYGVEMGEWQFGEVRFLSMLPGKIVDTPIRWRTNNGYHLSCLMGKT